MTIHELLQNSVACLKCRYEFADLEEANYNIFDKLASGDFPVCLVLPFNIQDYDRANGRIKSQAEINVYFLDRVPHPIDKPTTEIESLVVAPMRSLTRQFVNLIDDADMIEEEGIATLTNQSVHQGLADAHLYGNWGVFTVKFSEDLTTCE